MSPRGRGGPPRLSGELGASCLGSTFPSAQASWIPPAPAAPPPHFPPPAPLGPRGPPDPTAPLGVPSTELPTSLGLSAVPPPEGGPSVPWGAWGLMWPPARLRRWEPRTPGESRAAGNQQVGASVPAGGVQVVPEVCPSTLPVRWRPRWQDGPHAQAFLRRTGNQGLRADVRGASQSLRWPWSHGPSGGGRATHPFRRHR